MIDVLEIPDFFDAQTRSQLEADLMSAASAAATVLGLQAQAGVDMRVRKSARLQMPEGLVERVRQAILNRKPQFEEHFGVALTGCEAPQFLRYETGDYFVAHQDGNTPLTHDDTRFRRVSVVIFMSTQSEEAMPGTYGGGSLVLHGPYSGPDVRLPLNPPPGTLVAFRSETTHEVTPVTHGERFTIACFLRHDV